jgi:hypothetical protein
MSEGKSADNSTEYSENSFGKLPSDASDNASESETKIYRLFTAMIALHDEQASDCVTCQERLDCLADLVCDGCEPDAVLMAVEAHIRCCRDCREEFEALLSILRAERTGMIE